MKMFLLLQVLLGGQISSLPKTNLPLSNLQIVVDPGHGGENPGVRYKVNQGKDKKVFVEKIFTCDVSARLIKILENLGARVISTIKGSCLNHLEDNLLVSQSTPIEKEEFFSTNGERVRGDSSGLLERVNLTKEVAALHPLEKTIFVSIHFDSAFSKNAKGAYAIVPPGKTSSKLATSLIKEFNRAGLGQNFCHKTFAIIATNTCGIKKILILQKPPVPEMVLLELGNVSNNKERTWILDPKNREKYASTIAQGIIKFNKDR